MSNYTEAIIEHLCGVSYDLVCRHIDHPMRISPLNMTNELWFTVEMILGMGLGRLINDEIIGEW